MMDHSLEGQVETLVGDVLGLLRGQGSRWAGDEAELRATFQARLEGWVRTAAQQGIQPKVLAYLAQRPDLSLTHQDIARAIGSNRETVTRVLGRAVAEGLVVRVRRAAGWAYVVTD